MIGHGLSRRYRQRRKLAHHELIQFGAGDAYSGASRWIDGPGNPLSALRPGLRRHDAAKAAAVAAYEPPAPELACWNAARDRDDFL